MGKTTYWERLGIPLLQMDYAIVSERGVLSSRARAFLLEHVVPVLSDHFANCWVVVAEYLKAHNVVIRPKRLADQMRAHQVLCLFLLSFVAPVQQL